MFVGTRLRATGDLIFMRWLDSDYFNLAEWKNAAEAGA